MEMLNLSQQKEEKTIWCPSKLPYYKVCQRKFVCYRNEINADTYE